MYLFKRSAGGYIILLSLISLVPFAAGQTIYVDDDAASGGSGTSWVDAYKYLQDALTVAGEGMELRVAQGIYQPDQGAAMIPGNRQATFRLVNGVTIKGGYAGLGEADPEARDIELYETILSGDLSGNDVQVADPCDLPKAPSRSENSIHVVTGSGTNETAVLDGFTITAGNAHSSVKLEWDDPSARAGGMYNYSGSPKVQYCTFRANSADWYGGGMGNMMGSSPHLIHCSFTENAVGDYMDPINGGGYIYSSAGGMYNISHCNPVIEYCDFSDNKALYCGGIFNFESSPTLNYCKITNNVGWWGAGGMWNINSSPILSHCEFIANRNISMYGRGGGIRDQDSDSKLLNCVFEDNVGGWGGGMCIYHGSPILENCSFLGNSAADYGGAIFYWNSSHPILKYCSFRDNAAGLLGGGTFSFDNCNPTLSHCIYSGNSVSDKGGGMYNELNCNPTLTHCVFSENEVTNEGGGIHSLYNCSPVLTNCTFSKNSSKWKGGAIGHDSLTFINLSNCILWDNTAVTGPQISLGENTPLSVRYCDMEGGPDDIFVGTGGAIDWGEGNIDADPYFERTFGYLDDNQTPDDPNDDFWRDEDLHLRSEAGRWDPNTHNWVNDDETSPGIDAGDPTHSIGLELNPNGARINMGAYGGTMEASKSTSGIIKPICINPPTMDTNEDCRVDILDFAVFASEWLTCGFDIQQACW